MIIRSLQLWHGRIALPRFTTCHAHRRALATQSESISNTLDTDVVPVPKFIQAGHRQYEVRDPDHPVVRDLVFKEQQKSVTRPLGNAVEPHYLPSKMINNPPSPKHITLELLMASQAHIGHATSLWHPANAKYIFGIRGPENPIHIISLDVTAAHLRRACRIVEGVAERGGLILFVGNRTGQAKAVVKAAKLAKGCHLFTRWTPGALTNAEQILGKCRKKVVDEMDREVPGYESQLLDGSAIKPDLVVCLNPMENYILLHECGQHNIPTIGVVDTNCNPTWVTYPIPANDDSLRCIELIAGVLGRAGEQGQARRLEQAEQGIATYYFDHGLAPAQVGGGNAAEITAEGSAAYLEKELQAAVIANLQASHEEVTAETTEQEELDPSLVASEMTTPPADEMLDEADLAQLSEESNGNANQKPKNATKV